MQAQRQTTMLDARERAQGVSVENSVAPVDRERALGTKNELSLSSDFYADGFAQAIQPRAPTRAGSRRSVPHRSRRAALTRSPPAPARDRVAAGRHRPRDRAPAGTRALPRNAVHADPPAGSLIWVLADPVATETAPSGAVSVCAPVSFERGRRVEAVPQELRLCPRGRGEDEDEQGGCRRPVPLGSHGGGASCPHLRKARNPPSSRTRASRSKHKGSSSQTRGTLPFQPRPPLRSLDSGGHEGHQEQKEKER